MTEEQKTKEIRDQFNREGRSHDNLKGETFEEFGPEQTIVHAKPEDKELENAKRLEHVFRAGYAANTVADEQELDTEWKEFWEKNKHILK